ncbi:MAG: YrhK family protein [Allobranchiibius sp.]
MSDNHDLTLHIGHDELVIRQRYEVLSIANDILVGLWFIIGSILFFWVSTSTLAIWLFLLGSIEMIIRPIIRLARKLHVSYGLLNYVSNRPCCVQPTYGRAIAG